MRIANWLRKSDGVKPLVLTPLLRMIWLIDSDSDDEVSPDRRVFQMAEFISWEKVWRPARILVEPSAIITHDYHALH